MDLKSKIILISGPTASGKSKFALKLAKKINGEIINADSMQIYKECIILSARPSKKDQTEIKHHLYGFQSVKKNFSTGDWLKKTIKLIKQINNKNKIPILLFGREYCNKIINFEYLADHGLIEDEDLNLFQYADTAKEAWEIIKSSQTN